MTLSRLARPLATATKLLLIATGLCGLGACHDGEDAEKSDVARISESTGETTLRSAETSTARPTVVGERLREGDVVTTGADGEITITFDAGNSVRLGPQSSMVIERTGGKAAQFGALLISGSARAHSTGAAPRFTIGTPYGIAQIGGSESDVELSTDDGLVVKMGSIEVAMSDGQKRHIEAGGSLSLDGIVVRIPRRPAAAAEAVTTKPLNFVLLASSTQVQIRRAGQKDWRTASRRDELAAGDAVRTRKADTTRLQLGDHSAIVLKRETEVLVKEAAQSGPEAKSRFSLATGEISIEADNSADGTALHQVELAGQLVTIEPSVEEARVDLSATSGNRAQLAVRLGRARLASGEVIEAGNTVTLEQGGMTPSSLRPLAVTHVELKPGIDASVFYGGRLPPVRFVWDGSSAQPPFAIEAARDEGFTQSVFREEVRAQDFVFAELKPGRTFWRVRIGDDWQRGSVLIDRDRDEDCPSCKRLNVVDDTGENTIVYFQKTLPAITLRWGTADKATKYRVKIFADGAFDAPIVDETVGETTLALAAGRLAEGRYFWHIQSLDSKGKDVSTGRMNSLNIAYDNAVSDIEIRTPRPSAAVPAGSLTTQGEVALGTHLAVNGRELVVDRKGRFKETFAVGRGLNQIVYRILGSATAVRFYVRDVYAK